MVTARLRLTRVPYFFDDFGKSGDVSLDNNFFYIYGNGGWRKSPISSILYQSQLPLEINNSDRLGLKPGYVCYNKEYFFVYFNGWKRVAISPINDASVKKSSFSGKRLLSDMRISINTPITQYTYGQEGYVGFDISYFYIFVGKVWHKFAINPLPKKSDFIINSIWNEMTDYWEYSEYTF